MKLTKARQLAHQLMKKNGLSLWKWKFEFSKRSRTTAGWCRDRKGVHRIALNRIYTRLNSEKAVYEILLHEIAHALTPGHHHDGVWQRKCIEIGGNGQTYHHDKVPAGKYRRYCKVCKEFIKSVHRRTGGNSICISCKWNNAYPQRLAT
jgi:predicted SprT family Zn-dependent metalloprotease